MDGISKAYKGRAHLYGGAYNAVNEKPSSRKKIERVRDDFVKPVLESYEIVKYDKNHKKIFEKKEKGSNFDSRR